MVTASFGALGKIKRIAKVLGKFKAGITSLKSLPSAPKPCIQITLAVAVCVGSISTADKLGVVLNVFVSRVMINNRFINERLYKI
jgi:hypothetical protein